MKKNDTLITYGTVLARIKQIEETFPTICFGSTTFSQEYLNTWFRSVKKIHTELNALYNRKTKLEKTIKEKGSVKMTVQIDPNVDIDGNPSRIKRSRSQLLDFNKKHKVKILA